MPTSSAKSSSLYDFHPGVAMVQKWIADLKPKTGRTLDEWISLTKKDRPKDLASRRTWLKSKHNLGTNSAWWIAERAEGKGQIYRRPICRQKILSPPSIRRTPASRQIPRPRRQSLPLQNHGPALPRTRFRPDQAHHQLPHRSRPLLHHLQRQTPQTSHRHWRPRQKRSHHPPHRSLLPLQHRPRPQKVAPRRLPPRRLTSSFDSRSECRTLRLQGCGLDSNSAEFNPSSKVCHPEMRRLLPDRRTQPRIFFGPDSAVRGPAFMQESTTHRQRSAFMKPRIPTLIAAIALLCFSISLATRSQSNSPSPNSTQKETPMTLHWPTSRSGFRVGVVLVCHPDRRAASLAARSGGIVATLERHNNPSASP